MEELPDPKQEIAAPTAISSIHTDQMEGGNDTAMAETDMSVPTTTEQTEGIENHDTTTTELTIPKCEIPSNPEYETVASVVAAAVEEQHLKSISAGPPMVAAYRGLMDTLRSKQDPEMMRFILLALRTSGQGQTLTYLTQSATKHAPLIHLVVRLNPYELATENEEMKADYPMADAQLHLLVAVVSSNSVFLVPTLNALWKSLSASTYKYDQDAPVERYVGTIVPLHVIGSFLEANNHLNCAHCARCRAFLVPLVEHLVYMPQSQPCCA